MCQAKSSFNRRGLVAIRMRVANSQKRWSSYSSEKGCVRVETQKCQSGLKICGMQTRVMPFMSTMADDQGILDIKFHCCSIGRGETNQNEPCQILLKLNNNQFCQWMEALAPGANGGTVTNLAEVAGSVPGEPVTIHTRTP